METEKESRNELRNEIRSEPDGEKVLARNANRNLRKGEFSSHQSKHSGSRKSSVDTSNTANTKNTLFRLENTYKLGPDENKRFFAYKLQPNIVEFVVERMNNSEKLNPSGYNPKAVAALTRDLADSLRREAKNMSTPRFKVVVHVVAGENNQQDVRVGSRCLWNIDYDNCVSVSHKTKYVWASVVIYVLYTE